jgi:hypothetical protein
MLAHDLLHEYLKWKLTDFNEVFILYLSILHDELIDFRFICSKCYMGLVWTEIKDNIQMKVVDLSESNFMLCQIFYTMSILENPFRLSFT